jgi:hypothetical protein
MESCEFIVPGRPISMQSASRAAFRAWIERVAVAAIGAAPRIPAFWEPTVRLTIVFIGRSWRLDVDNVIKPLQDALSMIFYADDDRARDVQCHRRSFDEEVDADRLPPLLGEAWREQRECTYVRVQDTSRLEDLL